MKNNSNLINIFGLFSLLLFCINILYIFLHEHLPLTIFHNNFFDSFMDFFNVNANAFSDGRYKEDGWRSVYPPLTFVIGQYITPQSCEMYIKDVLYNSVWLRQCALSSFFLFFFLTYIVSIYITYKANLSMVSKQISFSNRFSLILIISLSFPMLYVIERGNYILLTYVFFVLSLICVRNLIKSILFGFVINFKPYAAFLIGYDFFKKNFQILFLTIFSTIIIFLTTYIILDDENTLLFIKNMFLFNTETSLNLSALNFTSSFETHFRFLKVVYNLDLFFIFNAFRILLLGLYMYFIINSDYDKNTFLIVSILFLSIFSDSFGFYFLIFLLPFLLKIFYMDKMIFIIILLILIPCDFILITKNIGPTELYFPYIFLNQGEFYSLSYQYQTVVIASGFILRPLLLLHTFIAIIKKTR